MKFNYLQWCRRDPRYFDDVLYEKVSARYPTTICMHQDSCSSMMCSKSPVARISNWIAASSNYFMT